MRYIIWFLLALAVWLVLSIPGEVISYTAPVVEAREETTKEFAQRLTGSEWESFNQIVIKESRWDCQAQNPHSTAYGCMQFLNSTWKIVGCVKTAVEREQIVCGIKYIEKVYGTPTKALEHHRRFNWY